MREELGGGSEGEGRTEWGGGTPVCMLFCLGIGLFDYAEVLRYILVFRFAGILSYT